VSKLIGLAAVGTQSKYLAAYELNPISLMSDEELFAAVAQEEVTKSPYEQ
jgi:hypothetical protein